MLGHPGPKDPDDKNHYREQEEDLDGIVDEKMEGPAQTGLGIEAKPVVNYKVCQF